MSINDRGGYGGGMRGLFGPLVLIGLGVIFLLDQFHVIYAGNAFSYFWPVVVIFFGAELLSRRLSTGRLLFGAALIAWGVSRILTNLGYWNYDYDLGRLWPLLLIAAGLAMLFGGGRGGRRNRHWLDHDPGPGGGSGPGIVDGGGASGASFSDDSSLDALAVLGGVQRRITSQKFRGGRVMAFFGGFNLDLTRANLAGDTAVLDLNAFFGGGEVRVPETWIVDMQGQALLGGYSDETHQNVPASGAKRLVVQGTALFGGVVVKN